MKEDEDLKPDPLICDVELFKGKKNYKKDTKNLVIRYC